ncbi:MAG: DUF2071 domain-containing protein [Acidobacteriota bacterium]
MAVFLTAEWRYLAMLNFSIEPDVLQPYLPAGTELDSWQGNSYVSMVGFLFLKTRVLGVPVPFHRNFEEVNLRFYVRRKGPEGWRRGVAFIKEIVPRRLVAAAARAVYGEPYVALPMQHRLALEGASLRRDALVEYCWFHQGRWNSLRAIVQGSPNLPREQSQEAFIAEHYWGYTAGRSGKSAEYRVEHPPWRVWQVRDAALDCDAASLYGPAFAGPLTAAPTSAFVAEGSFVSVKSGRLLENVNLGISV